MVVDIKRLQDLCSVCQDRGGKDDNGDPIVRTGFAAIDEDENAYYGVKVGISMRELTVDIVHENLGPIQDEEIYPPFPGDGSLTVAPKDTTSFYVKRTAWATYLDFKGGEFLPKLMLQEAKAMEFLLQNPHPNIIKYHGCHVKRNCITGLVLETFEFPHDLGFVSSRPDLFKGKLDKDRILAGIRSGLDHLHSLGWAHNDINPANILIDDAGEPKLIDFGSCQPFGAHLMSSGTKGWCKETFFHSAKENDEYSFEVFKPWLDEMVLKVEGSVVSQKSWEMKLQDVPPL